MAVLRVDDRYRVVLDKEVREFLKVEPGDKVLAIPSSEGVLMVSLRGRASTLLSLGFATRSGIMRLLASCLRRTRFSCLFLIPLCSLGPWTPRMLFTPSPSGF